MAKAISLPQFDQVKPIRFDFVLITANDNERDAVNAVFGLDHSGGESGLPYYTWGYLDLETGIRATVGHVNLGDDTGLLAAQAVTSTISRVLKPQYLLLVGTAGGFKRGNKSPDADCGDVVISTLVRAGPIKDDQKNTIRQKPLMPPSIALLRIANGLAGDWDSVKRWLRVGVPQGAKPKVVAQEVASTDMNWMDINQPIIQRLIVEFPRVVALEMEAAGVAVALHNVADDEWPPGYLVRRAA